MDTNELSKETYKAVLLTAEIFNYDLSLHFGCMAGKCKNEEEYILNAQQFVNACLKYKHKESLMDDLFFGNPPNEKDFNNILLKILDNIQKVKQIPIEQRTFEF
jgi:hypothetical protein